MKKMIIFDPAMCCSTGVCGPSVNPELLRISTVINNLKNKGLVIERYNLTNNPQIFVDNVTINEILMTSGVDSLPVTMIDGKVVKEGYYLSNEELCKLLEIPEDYLKVNIKRPNVCGCKGGCC